MKSIKPLGNGRWELETPRGKGFLVPHYQKPHGILDHDFIDASEGFWSVTARVVSIGSSTSVYMITLAKPDGMPVDAFDRGMDLMDYELAALKRFDCTTSLNVRSIERVHSRVGDADGYAHVFCIATRSRGNPPVRL